MSEKTLVQVFQEELAKASNNFHNLSQSSTRLNWWIETALNAVIEAHEARKLQTIDKAPLKKRIDELEQSIKNLHKVKGRYHTQQALESLFKLVGLENNIGEKNE